jgi:hypothetical protein
MIFEKPVSGIMEYLQRQNRQRWIDSAVPFI